MEGPADPRRDAVRGLGVALHLLQHPVAAGELARRLAAEESIDPRAVARVVRQLGLRARVARPARSRWARMPLPALLFGPDGRFLVVAAVRDGAAVVHDPEHGERVASLEELADGCGPVVVLAPPEGEARAPGRSTLGALLARLRRHPGATAQVLVGSLVVQLFVLATPLATMVIIDRVLSTESLRTLDVLIVALAAIAVFELAIGALRNRLMGDLAQRLDVGLARDVAEHLLRLPMAWFDRASTGDTVARLRDLETVRCFLTGPTLTTLIDVAFVGVFLLVMLLFSPLLTAVVTAILGGMAVVFWALLPWLRRRIDRRSHAAAAHQAFLVETVGGMGTVKALAAEPAFQRRWEDHLVGQSRAARAAEEWSQQGAQLAQFVSKGTLALTLWLGARAVVDGTLTAGQLIAFNMLVGRVMAPVARLAQMGNQLQQARTAAGRVGEVLATPVEPGAAPGQGAHHRVQGRITLEEVSFRYRDDLPPALEEVSLEVAAGEVIGVVGASGAGKSTLLRLLQGLYTPTSGRLRVDGHELAYADPAWLRSQLGVVPQDPILFSGTVRDNVLASRPELGEQQLQAAAVLAGVDRVVEALPGGYGFEVGERGLALSLGQRQRIALARALVSEPRVLLLDEPTSSLDAEGERIVQQHLFQIVAGRTAFVAAHRMSSLRPVHRVVVLEGGRVAECGTPRRLLEQGGRFAALCRAQGVESSFWKGAA